MSEASPPPDWYVDGRGFQRWWDGEAWGPYAPVTQQPVMYAKPPKSTSTAYLLLIFLGGFGVHQYYLRRVGHGIAYTVLWASNSVALFMDAATLARSINPFSVVILIVVLLMFLVDLFRIPTYVDRANVQPGVMPGHGVTGLSYKGSKLS